MGSSATTTSVSVSPTRPVHRRVGIVLNLLTHATRTIATGFARYASERGNWSLAVAHWHNDPHVLMGDIDLDRLDGLALGYKWQEMPRARCPLIFVGTPTTPNDPPTVCPDNVAIGGLAASRLMSLGVSYFSFVGLRRYAFSLERQAGFERGLATQQRSIQPPALFENWDKVAEGTRELDAWAATLLLPCAVFCADDRIASSVMLAARRAGIHIPEQLAILGVNDDDLTCAATIPPLSSISINGERIGYEAARQLDRIMSGSIPPRRTVTRIPPGRLVERSSTQVMGYGDPAVCEAMRLIRGRAAREAVRVDQVAYELGVPRQLLHRSFLQCVGRTAKQQIDQVRGDRLRALLISTTKPVKEIAFEMGFGSAPQLTRFCHRVLGAGPSALRDSAADPSKPVSAAARPRAAARRGRAKLRPAQTDDSHQGEA